MKRTLAELAREARAVQDACNLSGVAQAFARAMVDLGEHTSGTDARNHHPIARVWADKIASLTRTQTASSSEMVRVHREVDLLADGEETTLTEVCPMCDWNPSD